MALGTFKWFDVESGYGLISPDDGGRNLFMRSRDQASSSRFEAFAKGTEVNYEVKQGGTGMRAVDVCKRRSDSCRDDSLERHEGKEARHTYYAHPG